MKRGTVERIGGRMRVRLRGKGPLAARLRTLPDAVWEGDAAWFPASMAPSLLRELGAVEVTWSADALDAATQALPDAAAGDNFTPASLNQAVARLITEAFPTPVWVIGQLDGWSKGHRSYFDLIERKEGLSTARAKLSARITDRNREILEATAREAGFELQDGIEVRLRGRVELYVTGGSYQFSVTEVDVGFTLARFAETRQTVLATLRRERIAEANLALEVPTVPLRVGLISADGSDALADILSTLKASGLGFEVVFHASTMQGQRLQESILSALRWFYRHHEDVDVLCIVRGGGSRSDLAQFDSLGIARGVCLQKVPVLVGIGHELDQCVLDDVARSYRTPTAVATALVAHVQAFLERLAMAGRRTAAATRQRTAAAKMAVDAAQVRVGRGARRRLLDGAQRLAHLSRSIGRGAAADLAARRADLRVAGQRLQAGVRAQRRQAALRLDGLPIRLRRASAALARTEATRLAAMDARRGAADPARVLRRGYAIVRAADVVTSAADAPAGTPLRIQLAAGTLRATSNGAADDEP